MNERLCTGILAALNDSKLLRTVEMMRRDAGATLAVSSATRPLTAIEIQELKQLGNWADDWQTIQVCSPFNPRRIRGCTFRGEVKLGRFVGLATIGDGVQLPTGLYASTIVDCVIGDDALVRDVSLLANYVVAERAVVFDCGRIISSPGAKFGNDLVVNVGPQVGGRRVPVYAEIDLKSAAEAARIPSNEREWQEYSRHVAAYADQAAAPLGFIGAGSYVMHAGCIERTYIGTGCRIDGVSRISDSTLLGGEDEQTSVGAGAYISNCLLQWGSEIGPAAVIDRSVIMEHAHVGRHGKVSESIIGPNSAVAVGEVTACLIGPFVSAHHQSLLISLLWPEGRGNVAHGANIGSNHTTRCADQECWPGEGMFFGLGVNVKFPIDFSRAPFSVAAAGAILPPQRVEFPFSLIAPPANARSGLPLTHNEIRPAWMLEQNLYALRRLEAKHESRNRARRTQIDCSVLRHDVIQTVRVACHRLENVEQIRRVYSETEIPGLGKNFMLEEWRRRAVDAYRAAMSAYALAGLRDQILQALQSDPSAQVVNLLNQPSDDPVWEEQRSIITHDLRITDPVKGLWQFATLVEVELSLVEQSRKKDHELGRRIFSNYDEHHSPSNTDEIIVRTRELAERDRNQIRLLIERFSHVPTYRTAKKNLNLDLPLRKRA